MSRYNLPKTSVVDTNTLIFNFPKSKINELKKCLEIWEYSLPNYVSGATGKDYANLQIWARYQTDKPYQLFTPKGANPKLYIVYKNKNNITEINFEGQPLTGRPLDNLQYLLSEPTNNSSIIACIIKVLIANFVHQKGEFISNNKFYLVSNTYSSKRKNYYAEVLKISPQLKSHQNIDNQHTGLTELFLGDKATRLKRIEFQNRYMGNIPFDFVVLPNGQLAFKQLKTLNTEEDKDKLIYEENTSKKYRTKIKFHTIKSLDAYEETRNFLLSTFSKDLEKYFIELGFHVKSKKLYLEQKLSTLSSKTGLTFENFKIFVFDKRFNRKEDFQSIITKLNSTNYGIQFIASTENETQHKNNTLILMDYSIGDCEEHGVLKNKINEDGYKIIKKLGFKNSQGFCLNINTFDKKKEEFSETEFLNYPKIKITEGKIDDIDLQRNFEICLQQLFLKSLLINAIEIKHKLPFINIVNKLVFIHCFTRNKQRFEFICYVENDILEIENLRSNKAKHVLEKLGYSELEDLILHWKQLNPYSNFDKGTLHWMLSNTFFWEIKEIPERVLYPSELHEVLREREEEISKEYFKLKMNNVFFSSEKTKKYNDFIEQEIYDSISFEELVKKSGKYRKKILDILDINKETNLAKALNYRGKKAEFFTTSKGVWLDKSNLQYFVGKKDSYQYNQVTGFQLRKIILHKGQFQEDLFFPLLNVNFIKYKSFTVVPYIFRLMKMFAEIGLK